MSAFVRLSEFASRGRGFESHRLHHVRPGQRYCRPAPDAFRSARFGVSIARPSRGAPFAGRVPLRDELVEAAGDFDVSLVRGVLVAQRGGARRVAHPVHQLRGRGAGSGGHRVGGVAEIVEVEAVREIGDRCSRAGPVAIDGPLAQYVGATVRTPASVLGAHTRSSPLLSSICCCSTRTVRWRSAKPTGWWTSMSVAALRTVAGEHGIDVPAGMHRRELVELLSERDVPRVLRPRNRLSRAFS
jgi:hypothetical protein